MQLIFQKKGFDWSNLGQVMTPPVQSAVIGVCLGVTGAHSVIHC